MILSSKPVSEFVLACAQGIRENLCHRYSCLIHSRSFSISVSIRVNLCHRYPCLKTSRKGSCLIHSHHPQISHLALSARFPLRTNSWELAVNALFVSSRPTVNYAKQSQSWRAGMNANSCVTKSYKKNSPRPARKNKPNQTQFIPRNTPPRPLAAQYAIRETNPIPARRTAKAAPAHGSPGHPTFLNFCSKNSLTTPAGSVKYMVFYCKWELFYEELYG